MIEIKDLTKKYGNTVVFDHTDYTFPETGLVCLLGSSGSGKSTLLNILAGFDTSYTGSIAVGQLAINQLSMDQLCTYRANHIGFVFQDYHLLKGYTVLENVLLASSHCLEDRCKELEKAQSLLQMVGLTEKQNQKIENLSGGQKQRAAIVRALMGDARIILADEPTGALDRENSTSIMNLLKEISKEKLVIVITHDQKIVPFAEETITIEKGKISCDPQCKTTEKKIILDTVSKKDLRLKSGKNFKVHLKRYLAVSFAISIGIFCLLLSFSFKNEIKNSIRQFQEKNTAFNNGYIKIEGESDKILSFLETDDRIERAYKQYKVTDVTLKFEAKTEVMKEKYPMPKTSETMSYGVMPRRGKQEIAFSPSLAKKFQNPIHELIGKTILLTLNGQQYSLTVSGIFNAGYDDFFISSDLEEKLYQNTKADVYSISYDVGRFEDILAVSNALEKEGIKAFSAKEEVRAFQTAFESIHRLFLIISILILAISLFLSVILLVKLRNSRYKEIGLLSALGFNRRSIRKMLIGETFFLAILASLFSTVWIGLSSIFHIMFSFPFSFSFYQTVLCVVSTFLVLLVTSLLTSHKLIYTEAAVALKKG